VKEKAQMDLQALEDIKLINKMTHENAILDINNKLNETEERRMQY
jgi:hypothetical protein